MATFRVASTPRIRDAATNEWKDDESLFLTCNVWRQAAENVAESLQWGKHTVWVVLATVAHPKKTERR